MFASCGEDGSVRIFDTNDLKQSNIIYESPDRRPLIKVAWNYENAYTLGLIAEEDSKVQLLDIRKATMPVGVLQHDSAVNAFAWNANKLNQICTVQDDNKAQIWEYPTK